MNLGLNDVNFGHVVYPPGGSYGPFQQKDYQIVLVMQGEARVRHHGGEESVPVRHMFFLLPGPQPRRIDFALRRSTVHTWVSSQTARFTPELRGLLQAPPFAMPVTRSMETMVELGLQRIRSGNPLHQRQCIGLAECVFLEYLALKRGMSQATGHHPPAVERVLSLIEKRYGEPLTLELLATAAHLTPAYLIRLFRHRLGQTPMRYLWRYRCEQAADLLRDTGLGIAEIGARTGFQTPSHFTRGMRAHFGRSPSELRLEFWNPPQSGAASK